MGKKLTMQDNFDFALQVEKLEEITKDDQIVALKRQLKEVERRAAKAEKQQLNADKELTNTKKLLAQQRAKNKDLQKELDRKKVEHTSIRRNLEDTAQRLGRMETALKVIARTDGTEDERVQWNDMEWGIFKTTQSNCYRIGNLQKDYSFCIRVVDGLPQVEEMVPPPDHVIAKVVELSNQKGSTSYKL